MIGDHDFNYYAYSSSESKTLGRTSGSSVIKTKVNQDHEFKASLKGSTPKGDMNLIQMMPRYYDDSKSLSSRILLLSLPSLLPTLQLPQARPMGEKERDARRGRGREINYTERGKKGGRKM